VRDRDAVLLLTAPVAERDRARGDVVVPGQQHVRHLLPLRVPDLLLHPVVTGVDLGPDASLAQPARDLLQVRHVRVGDRDPGHLDRRQPRRESAGIVLAQGPEEPPHPAGQAPGDPYRAAAGGSCMAGAGCRRPPDTPSRTGPGAGSRPAGWTAASGGRSRPGRARRSWARRTPPRPRRSRTPGLMRPARASAPPRPGPTPP